ncbi:hypothetical protein DL96DRAFT_600874 [Flagelloscypha sp. PMI_526]|nr:hypothetical protein DL96DRAFT_600874 [Flagelloscypha sp. PMI_526]
MLRWTIASVLLSFLVVSFQLYLKPAIKVVGYGREIENLRNNKCHTFDSLESCESAVLDEQTDTLYLACSTIASRIAWAPAGDSFNFSGMSHEDYVAAFKFNRDNPAKSEVQKFKFDAASPFVSLHGIDITRSTNGELHMFLNSHRPPLAPEKRLVQYSTVEWFKVDAATKTLVYQATFDEHVSTPNGVAAAENADGVWFTNDHGPYLDGWVRKAQVDLLFPRTFSIGTLGYCSTKSRKCRIVAENLMYPNGIARSGSQIFVAGSSTVGAAYVYDIVEEEEGTLQLNTTIIMDRPQDNVSADSEGNLWFAGFPRAHTLFEMFKNPAIFQPSSGIKVSPSGTGFTWEKVFEDPGRVSSGATSVIHHPKHNLLFISGVAMPMLTVCEI